MDYEQDLKDYCKAMRNSDIEMCIAIEKKHYLFGYPPEIVTSVLSKAANGMDLAVAVDECMREERQDVRIKANEELRKLRQDNAQLQYALEQSESAYLKLAGNARCEYCDGTGYVHSQVGEFLGLCRCGVPLNLERKEL